MEMEIKKRISKAVLQAALICAIWFLIGGNAKAEPQENDNEQTELTLYFHYLRYNGDYQDWTLWLWQTGMDGKEYAFTQDADEAGVATEVKLQGISGDTAIGTLLKYKNWEKKDVAADRYLDLSKAQNGMLHVYFLQEEEQIFYSREEINKGQRIIRAKYDDVDKVSFILYCQDLSQDEEQITFLVEDEDGETFSLVDLEMLRDGNLITGSGTPAEPMELSRSYYLFAEGMEKKEIQPGDIFSTKAFEDAYTYEGNDLGAVYKEEETAFRVWAPTASKVEVNLYKTGNGDDLMGSYPMEQAEKGTWYLKLDGDYQGVYYTYSVTVHGATKEAVDPYAKACGINGMRGMIVDLQKTDPEGFPEETKPELDSFTDIILYEMSIRDYTIDETSGVQEKGKYLGLTEEGTVNSKGEPTALDYLGELGVTHVHLLPSQDFGGVDEERPTESYNWGYGTQNFNVPEGSYSTDPYHGEVRINEYKQMVQSLHKKGIRVVMDVVYNHTYDTEESNFNKIVPGYYYRMREDGTYSNGSACGNEVATERAMVRKFIVDSVAYWAEEYHVDGFRFDLMGLIDIETMNQVRERLDEIDESIYVYGEGWTGGDTVSTEEMAESENARNMPGIAVFSNVFRRGIQKYVSGIFEEEVSKNSVLFGVVAATKQEITKQSMGSWTEKPTQCINYASCHDGFTLWDLIRQNCSGESEQMWKKRNKLSAAIVMTCQGVPFIHSGEEMLRSKVAKDDPTRIYSNSYSANDYVNSIKWNSVSEQTDMVSYYKGLMQFRKEHPGLCYETAEEIQESMEFLQDLEENVIGYTVVEKKNILLENKICMLYNPTSAETPVTLPKGSWKVYINGEQAGTEIIERLKGGNQIRIPEEEALVMVSTYVRKEVLYAGAVAIALACIIIGSVKIIHRSKRRKEATLGTMVEHS